MFAFRITNIQGQKGLLGKLNEKLEQANASSGNAPKGTVNEKEVKKDLELTLLDSKPINKDSRNISGIYFSKTPIRVRQAGSGKFNFAKKFLVNYEEGEKQEIEFATRYYFENRKDILHFIYAPAPGTPDYFPVTTSKKTGHLHLGGLSDKKYGGSASNNYAAPSTYLSFSGPDGNYRTDESMSFNFSHLLEFEEGVIFVGRTD